MLRELSRVWVGVGGTLVAKISDLSKKMYLTKSSVANTIVIIYRVEWGRERERRRIHVNTLLQWSHSTTFNFLLTHLVGSQIENLPPQVIWQWHFFQVSLSIQFSFALHFTVSHDQVTATGGKAKG